MRGLRRDGNAEDIWTASQNSKSCGKSISIETANLREYARYVLRTICQQVFFRFNLPLSVLLFFWRERPTTVGNLYIDSPLLPSHFILK